MNIKLKYHIITLSIIILICVIISYVYLTSADELENIYKEQTLESIRDTKKAFIKDTVNNLIVEIDLLHDVRRQFYEGLVMESAVRFENLKGEADASYINLIKTYFDEQSSAIEWTVIVWNHDTQTEIYNPLDLSIASWDETMNSLTPSLSSYKIVTHGPIIMLVGISKTLIDSEVQTMIHDKIHTYSFQEGSYIWVNEVLNFEGGKDYATRKIHPNLPETEGMYLSTDMTDIKGNFPYQVELDGINKDGDIFFTYFFKKLNSEIIAEKLSYSKLYKPYNWIIGMGIYLDDLQTFVDRTNKRSQELASRSILILAALLSFVVFVGFGLQIIVERWSYRNVKKNMETEINYDVLTKAFSRNYGIKALSKSLDKFKNGDHLYTVMMFDIDSFKQINDRYGHEFGDTVLRTISAEVIDLIRATDTLSRWGGDEFVLIFDGLRNERAESVALKVLEVVSNIRLDVNNTVVMPTISLGVSYFEHTDKDYKDVVKRADLAMYHAKSSGKNKMSMF